MDPRELLRFMRSSRFWVEATISPEGAPQAAVVGAVVSDAFELFFDTSSSSRKCANLRAHGRMAFVLWEGPRTVQLEGVADEPKGTELERLKALYFATFPDGPERAALPDIVYVRVRPVWIRDSDFATTPPRITELDPALLVSHA